MWPSGLPRSPVRFASARTWRRRDVPHRQRLRGCISAASRLRPVCAGEMRHLVVQRRHDARQEPARRPAARHVQRHIPQLSAPSGGSKRAGLRAGLLHRGRASSARVVEEEAEALGHVAQVRSLAPDEQPEGEVGDLVIKQLSLNYLLITARGRGRRPCSATRPTPRRTARRLRGGPPTSGSCA